MKKSAFRAATSAALLGAALGCGPQSSPANTDGEVIDQPKSGILKLDNLPNGSAPAHRITATFVDAPSNARCTIKEQGPCRLIDCPAARNGLVTDAGNLTVTGAISVPLIFTPSRGYEGSGARVDGALFEAGKDVSAKAAGATVPSFNVSVKGPSAVSVTAPMDSTLSINRGTDLAVSWSGASEGKFVFQLQAQPSNYPLFECRFDAKGSSGTIPTAALQLLSPGSYQADAFSRMRSVVTVEDWSVQVDARYYAGTNGSGYKRSAVVQ